MKTKIFLLLGISALCALFFASEKSQSVRIGSSNATGWFADDTEDDEKDEPQPIPPIGWPDPIKRPSIIDLQEATLG